MFQCAQKVVTQHDTEGGREGGRKGGNGCHEMCPGEGGSDGSHSRVLLGEAVGVNGLLVTGMEGDHGAENKASPVSYPARSTSEIKKSRNLMRGRRGTVPTFPKHYHDRRWANDSIGTPPSISPLSNRRRRCMYTSGRILLRICTRVLLPSRIPPQFFRAIRTPYIQGSYNSAR